MWWTALTLRHRCAIGWLGRNATTLRRAVHGPGADGFGLVWLDIGDRNQFAPLLGFVGDVLRELRRRTREHDDTQVGKPRLNLGIGEARVDLRVDLVDDPDWRVPGSSDAAPATRLETGHGFSDRRDVRQRLQTCRSRHRQCTQFANPDMFEG